MGKRAIIFTALILILFASCQAKSQAPVPSPVPAVSVTEEVVPDEGVTVRPTDVNGLSETDYNRYTINLDVNPSTGVVKGSMEVIFYNKSDDVMDTICFNVPFNAFAAEASYIPYFSDFKSKIFTGDREYCSFDISSVLYNDNNAGFDVLDTVLNVSTDGLEPGAYAEISIQFEAYVPYMNHRTGANKNAMWFGAFLPYAAVYEDGAFRTQPYYPAGDPFYSESANYSVSITTPKNYNIVGTGTASVREDESSKTTTLTALMVRDFTFAVIDRSYKAISLTTQNGVEINMYYRSNLSVTDTLIKQAENAVNFYENYVGGYPYGKIDIVETGLFVSGGMEFSQVIFMDGDYMANPESAKTMIHEIGQQWFYNIVGSDQINSAWMDEGLVALLQEKVTYPDSEQFAKYFESEYTRLGQSIEALSSLKLKDGISGYKDWTNYYNIQYTKGKLMLYSLNMKMGEEKFNQFIKEYYSAYSFKIATEEDFIKVAEDVYGESLGAFFNRWLFSEKLPPLYG
ncbi:MAG: M1 family metallopeptidase [Clostridiales bacterium]|jgi:hypothetical protein|nr:M1 family metallopeptidase [Clostridiales bacterium]